MKKPRDRGPSAVKWIEQYCLVPSGPNKGDPVVLTTEPHSRGPQIFWPKITSRFARFALSGR
ncbi:MAG TPA: hypothetical protein VFP79_02750, partial [Pseudolabrys sp.]|nr:hypothetical protein [Pseudolabrys sp.]